MTYPHRPGPKARSTALSPLPSAPWTVRKSPTFKAAACPMRRYEVMALTAEGELIDDVRAAPARPLFEAAFTALARGTILPTDEGPVAVEDLVPGQQIETRDNGYQTLLWKGATTIVPRASDKSGLACLYRIPMDAFGPQRPSPDLVLGPSARLVHRSPALCDIVGHDSALVPLQAFEDGFNVIRVTPVSPVRVFHLGFAQHQIISVNGLEIDSAHPGADFAATLDGETLRMYLAMFPHISGRNGFGPLVMPRLSREGCELLSAA